MLVNFFQTISIIVYFCICILVASWIALCHSWLMGGGVGAAQKGLPRKVDVKPFSTELCPSSSPVFSIYFFLQIYLEPFFVDDTIGLVKVCIKTFKTRSKRSCTKAVLNVEQEEGSKEANGVPGVQSSPSMGKLCTGKSLSQRIATFNKLICSQIGEGLKVSFGNENPNAHISASFLVCV